MTTHRQWARLLTAVSEHSHSDPVPDALLRAAVTLGLDAAPGAMGCSITQLHGAAFSTPFASDELAMALDQAQYTAGAGPCVAAARDGRPQRIDDMASESRFRAFTEVATGRGVHSSLSVPLTGTARPSAVNLYAGGTAAFDNARSRAVAALLADCLSALLPRAAGWSATVAHDAELTAARSDGRAVTEATDRLMQELGLTRSAAFDRLARSAAATHRHIAGVAHELLSDDEVIA